MAADYKIEILNNNNGSMTKVAEVINPLAINKSGTILQFTKELSDFGQCQFRISAFDNILTQYGDIFIPHKYHVRIRRNGTIVWRGAIIDNPKRTKEYWEIECAEYEWYLNRILINRTSDDPNGGGADGIYRIFNSGTMAQAVTDLINESITTYNQTNNKSSILSGMTLGEIDNPNFPPNLTDDTGAALTGAWTFSDNLQLQFDFQSVLYALKKMGVLSYADFEVDENLVFNFLKFLGNDRHYDVNFVFNKSGVSSQSNVIDYNAPRLGQRMVNSLWGIATDTNGTILHSSSPYQPSITEYGLLEGVAAYSDVNDQGILNAQTLAEQNLIDEPDTSNIVMVLNPGAAYPLGVWDIGDIVSLQIVNNGINFKDSRRIVGVSVDVKDNGVETTTVQTNIVQPFQYGDIA